MFQISVLELCTHKTKLICNKYFITGKDTAVKHIILPEKHTDGLNLINVSRKMEYDYYHLSPVPFAEDGR